MIEMVDQPESEQGPGTIPATPTLDTPRTGNPLTDAFRSSVRALDGLPRQFPGREQRPRSRSPHRQPADIPVPHGGEDALMAKKQRDFHAFFARRIYKKKRQVGAGREVNYKNSDVEVKQRLDLTRKKEWSNWNQFGAVQVLRPEDQEQFFRDHPEAEVIPTRWVDTDKAEPDQPSEYKSRLVARGDLEKNNQLRTGFTDYISAFSQPDCLLQCKQEERPEGRRHFGSLSSGCWNRKEVGVETTGRWSTR